MFYDNLKQVCKEKGTSVTSTLKEIGIGTANGTYWKNGSYPNGDILIKLSEFLNISIDYLLGRTDNPNSHTYTEAELEEIKKALNPDLSDLELECLEKFNKLEDIDKGRILDRMDTIFDGYSPEQEEGVS